MAIDIVLNGASCTTQRWLWGALLRRRPLQRWEVLISPLKMSPDLTGVQSRHLHCKSVLLLPTITHESTDLGLRRIRHWDEKG